MKSFLVLAIFLGMILVSSTVVSQSTFADVIPPNKQLSLDFTAKEIICKENLVKVIRTTNGNPVCIKPDAVDSFTERGIIQSVNPQIVAEALENKSEPVGKIIHLATTKPHIDPSEVVTSKKISTFNYVFKVCSDDNTRIKAPEVIISSDKETKSIKLPHDVLAGSCNTTAVKVKASDPNSITSKLLNHGGVTEIITELENKIENLKLDITEQREKLSGINVEIPSSERAKKVSAIHKSITDVRNELKETRAELQKYLLFLNLKPTSDLYPIQKGKSITGIEVNDTLSEIISIHKALIQPETLPENSTAFNVIFEVCTDKEILRIPVVEMTSDLETKTIRMAEKIVTNSCQVTTAKIIANSADSISIQLAGKTATSDSIIELETKIASLKDKMSEEQRKLNSAATSSTLTKDERNVTIAQSTSIIEDLRKEINNNKVQLHKILLEVYR